MKSRQTFYIEKSVGEKLRTVAYKRKVKISTLVDDALESYLDGIDKFPPGKNSLLNAAGKIRSFVRENPLIWQKRMRSEWDRGKS